MPSAKALAGKLIKAKIAKDAASETELWAMRSLYRDHFKLAIGQAALHQGKVTIRLLAEAITWACAESSVPRRELTKAYRTLNLTPPRKPKRH